MFKPAQHQSADKAEPDTPPTASSSAEVEQALRDLCHTSQVCALGVPDSRLDEVVAAVMVAPKVSDWADLVAQLRGRLAGFKVPRAMYLADSLPMTATNRVQRATLRQWIESGKLQRVM